MMFLDIPNRWTVGRVNPSLPGLRQLSLWDVRKIFKIFLDGPVYQE